MVPNRSIRVACAIAVVAAVLTAPAWAEPDPATMDDAVFLDWLDSAEAADAQVDPRRVAKLLFGVAATLDGNRTNARLLQNAVVLREPDGELVRGTVAASFQRYSDAADRFRASVSSLLDRPSSMAQLQRSLVDGERACWLLDSYARLTETYGARPGALMSILTSTEACQRFRRAAFHPHVQKPITDALESTARDRSEIEALQEEIEELERLVDDLRAIDSR